MYSIIYIIKIKPKSSYPHKEKNINIIYLNHFIEIKFVCYKDYIYNIVILCYYSFCSVYKLIKIYSKIIIIIKFIYMIILTKN